MSVCFTVFCGVMGGLFGMFTGGVLALYRAKKGIKAKAASEHEKFYDRESQAVSRRRGMLVGAMVGGIIGCMGCAGGMVGGLAAMIGAPLALPAGWMVSKVVARFYRNFVNQIYRFTDVIIAVTEAATTRIEKGDN